MAILTINNLTKKYKEVVALDGLSLSLEQGKVLGFIGQNGAGKTTTLRLLTGLSKPDSGEITVCGEKVVFGKLSTNKYIGFLPDVPEFYGYMKPMEYLTLCGQLYGLDRNVLKHESERLLTVVGLSGVNRKIKGFSRGMKQRLGIAQALIHKPQILLLDEPTSALDPLGRHEVLDIITSLRGSISVMFSTHILADAQNVCDDICVLDKGKPALIGSMDSIRAKYGTHNIRISIVQADRLEELSRRIKELSFVTKVHIEGDALTLSCTETNGIYEAICPLLSEMQLFLKSFIPEQSSLEDVFMEVIGK